LVIAFLGIAWGEKFVLGIEFFELFAEGEILLLKGN
jgi:hypothetical protein